MGRFNALLIRLAWQFGLPEMRHVERSTCAVLRFISKDAASCEVFFRLITRIEHTSPSARIAWVS